MSMVGFPLLLIPLAVYNIIVFLMPGVSLTDPLFKVALVSGADWPISLSEILLALGVLLLLLEIIKGARPGAKYLTDHLLSLIVFGAAAAEFLLWPKFASSTFFLLALLSLTDFLSGITLRQRRVMQPAPAAVSRRAARTTMQAETAAAEPRFEPQVAPPPAAPAPEPPAPDVPPAASVAESVLSEHSGPKPSQPATSPGEPSATAPSPELRPGAGTAASPETPRH